MWILFDLVFLIYIIIYFPFLLLRGKWHDGMKVRLGCIPKDVSIKLRGKRNIWLHAVSVGEVVALESIIGRLRERYPDRQLVLSVTTKTGHSLAVKKYREWAVVLWSPLDFSFSVNIFINAIRPELYIAAETELWPNLFSCLADRAIPVMVVNGRISDTAFPRYLAVRWFLRPIMARVNVFCMQSDLDVKRVVLLGAQNNRVINVGNVKFDQVASARTVQVRDLGLETGTLVWVAGSTHPGEEEIIVDIFAELRKEFPALRVVIAPRHPERARDLSAMISERGFRPVLFSSVRETPLGAEEILLVDTIGHLVQFYSVATVVFVGKSLTVRGGHNIIEAGAFAKPILVGPHMQNFLDITRIFLEARALVQVQDIKELKAELAALLASPEKRFQLGQRAKEVIECNRGATDRTIRIVAEHCRAGS